MKKIEIKSWITGEVIFSHETNGNAIKLTVDAAIKLKANLRYADLRDADLRDANLRDANLISSDLRGAIGNNIEIKSMQLPMWNISFSLNEQSLAIGCQQHSIAKWKEFTDDEISEMDAGALDWWKKWSAFIFKAIELSEDKR